MLESSRGCEHVKAAEIMNCLDLHFDLAISPNGTFEKIAFIEPNKLDANISAANQMICYQDCPSCHKSLSLNIFVHQISQDLGEEMAPPTAAIEFPAFEPLKEEECSFEIKVEPEVEPMEQDSSCDENKNVDHLQESELESTTENDEEYQVPKHKKKKASRRPPSIPGEYPCKNCGKVFRLKGV